MHAAYLGTIRCNWSTSHMLQPVDVFRSEHLPGPAGGAAGHRVEILQRKLAAASAVVIASDKGLAQLTRSLNHFVRRRSIAYDIASVPGHVVLRGSVQHCLQGINVGVNIGNE